MICLRVGPDHARTLPGWKRARQLAVLAALFVSLLGSDTASSEESAIGQPFFNEPDPSPNISASYPYRHIPVPASTGMRELPFWPQPEACCLFGPTYAASS
ncbi:hypothetical protein PWT90_10069 [Aphanocladium album]|nr:hypothetical protein PWT90_10069 [Aphanocladium album]